MREQGKRERERERERTRVSMVISHLPCRDTIVKGVS